MFSFIKIYVCICSFFVFSCFSNFRCSQASTGGAKRCNGVQRACALRRLLVWNSQTVSAQFDRCASFFSRFRKLPTSLFEHRSTFQARNPPTQRTTLSTWSVLSRPLWPCYHRTCVMCHRQDTGLSPLVSNSHAPPLSNAPYLSSWAVHLWNTESLKWR